MIQKSYHITDFTDGSFEDMLKQVSQMPAYQKAEQVLLSVFEQNWDISEIKSKIHRIREAVPKAEIFGINHYEDLTMLTVKMSAFNFMFFEEKAFCIRHFSMEGFSDEEIGEKLHDAITPETKGVMTAFSQRERNVDLIVSRAQKENPEVAIFGAAGAIAQQSDETATSYSYVFDCEECYRDTLLAVFFDGENLSVKASYNYGWTPIGKPMTITAMEGDFRVKEIDHRPAAEIYKKYLGLPLPQQIQMANICEFPLIVDRDGLTAARIPIGSDKEGALLFNAALKEGESVRFSYGAQLRIFSEIYHNSKEFCEFGPQGMFLIVCLNRLIFLKEQEQFEIEHYQQLSSQLAVLHGNSEIYRYDGAGGELNSALIAVGIREGAPQKKEFCINNNFLVEDMVQNNYMIPLEYRVMTFMSAVTEELEDMTRQANAANQAKSYFLSSMSHEIRTPINAVLGMNEMILRESTQTEIREYASDIQSAGNTLLSLINDILDLSKIESGKMEIVPGKYDLSSMIHDLAQMISFRAKSKNLDLVVKVKEDLPSELYGDDVRIRQVLTNILTNAVKYTEKGTVTMLIDGETSGDYVLLRCEVKDTGIGIKEEDMPRLFSAFERIEEKRNRNVEGTGLGMNITTRLLNLMDSQLQVESVYGEGSRFWFELRQKIVNPAPMGNFEERMRAIAGEYEYHQSFCAPEAKILVVDDNVLNLKVFVSLLKQTKVQITTAESGSECLALTEKNHYDIIFLDHMMPDMDGIETLERLRSGKGNLNSKTPVYALTANAVAGAKETYLEAGFDGFLSKPIVSEKLENAIRKMLPEEKLVQPAKVEEPTEKKESKKAGELLAIEGLDWDYAKLHLADFDLLIEAVHDFYEMIDSQGKKLQQFYEQMNSSQKTEREKEQILNSYRIQVHGMKSSAATIGITLLAGMANRLEFASRDGERELIQKLHPVFLSDWYSYREKLSSLFPETEQTEKKSETPEAAEDLPHIAARLEMLKNAMEVLDLDTADACIEALMAYRYQDEAAEILSQLKAAVTALEAEQVASLADELYQKLI